MAELEKNLTKLKENAPSLSEAELKAKVKEFNESIKKNSQRSLENLDKWYKSAENKKGNIDLEAEANLAASSFEEGLSRQLKTKYRMLPLTRSPPQSLLLRS